MSNEPELRVCALLPARLQSSRLPGKLLKKLNDGKTVLYHTWVETCKSKSVEEVFVCGDDPELEAEVKSFGGQYIATSDKPVNGTERIAEALAQVPEKYNVIVNVQADEPYTNHAHLDTVVELYRTIAADESVACTSVWAPIEDEAEAVDRATVKMVTDKNNFCLYQSRALIPHSKDGAYDPSFPYKKFVGLTAFRRSFLPVFVSEVTQPCQGHEDVEYNKILELGYKIKLGPIDFCERGVNTPEDLEYLLNKYK